jgi:hypothetical protein
MLQYFVWSTQEIGMKFIAFGFKAGLAKVIGDGLSTCYPLGYDEML